MVLHPDLLIISIFGVILLVLSAALGRFFFLILPKEFTGEPVLTGLWEGTRGLLALEHFASPVRMVQKDSPAHIFSRTFRCDGLGGKQHSMWMDVLCRLENPRLT